MTANLQIIEMPITEIITENFPKCSGQVPKWDMNRMGWMHCTGPGIYKLEKGGEHTGYLCQKCFDRVLDNAVRPPESA